MKNKGTVNPHAFMILYSPIIIIGATSGPSESCHWEYKQKTSDNKRWGRCKNFVSKRERNGVSSYKTLIYLQVVDIMAAFIKT